MMDRLRSPRLRLLLQVALVVLCLVPIGRQAARDWETVSLLARRLEAPAVLASVLALGVASLFLPTAMASFTRGAAGRISYRDSALAYFGSQPMKYLPGSFWILPGRVILLRGLGHDASLSSAALFFEMTTQVFSSALVAALLAGLAGLASAWYEEAAWLALAGSAAAAALLLGAPALLRRLPDRFARARRTLAELAAVPLAARLQNVLLATLYYAIMWVLMGASFYALMVAADPRLDPGLLVVAIGVSTLSWLAGFLTPFSPGGIGVREGAIVLLLSPFLGGAQAVMVALLARVIALAVELAFFAAVWAPLRAAQARVPSIPPRNRAARR